VTADNEHRERRRGRTRDQATRSSALPDQRPFAQPRLRQPPTELLSADQIETIHQAALRVLRDIGLKVLAPEPRQIYASGGATARDQQVTFDPEMVEQLIVTAPAELNTTEPKFIKSPAVVPSVMLVPLKLALFVTTTFAVASLVIPAVEVSERLWPVLVPLKSVAESS